MTKQEFDEKYVGCTTRVHCPTKELNDEFIDLARSFGYTRSDKWKDYEHNICYNVVDNLCGAIEYYVRCDYNIVEFKSLKEESMKDLRDLLKVGRVVETIDGEMGFLLEDRILYSEGWDDLRRFDEDLKHEFDKDADIMTVYNCPITNGYAWHFGLEVKMFLDTIWRRKEAKVFEILDVENVMLSNLNDSFKYIARNHNGTLNIYKTKPTKQKVCWVSIDYTDFSEYAHLFKYVEWKDAEPTLIEDLIKMKTVAF